MTTTPAMGKLKFLSNLKYIFISFVVLHSFTVIVCFATVFAPHKLFVLYASYEQLYDSYRENRLCI
jgi:O-antigen ligase